MECREFDWRGYSLGELGPAEAVQHESHALLCETCRNELARWQPTLQSLRSLPQVEPPRQIVFVSDSILPEPWWRRMWKAGPQLGFASAAMLSLAIVTHAFVARPPAVAVGASQPGLEARIQAEAQKEIDRQLPVAMRAALKSTLDEQYETQIRPALAQMERQAGEREKLSLSSLEQRVDQKRQSDLQAIRYALETYDRRLQFAMLSASRKVGGE